MSLNELKVPLLAGTYTNFGANPTVVAYEKKIRPGSFGIAISKNINHNMTTLMDGTVLFETQEGYVYGYDKRSAINRENLLADVIKILEDTSYNIEFLKIERRDLHRLYSFRIHIKRLR